MNFFLAFYVSQVVTRWWAQWNALPWPDEVAYQMSKEDFFNQMFPNLTEVMLTGCVKVSTVLAMTSTADW